MPTRNRNISRICKTTTLYLCHENSLGSREKSCFYDYLTYFQSKEENGNLKSVTVSHIYCLLTPDVNFLKFLAKRAKHASSPSSSSSSSLDSFLALSFPFRSNYRALKCCKGIHLSIDNKIYGLLCL